MATPVHALSAAGERITRALILLVLCIFIGATAFFLIGINVYPFTSAQVTRRRVWLIVASVCLIIQNALVVLALISAQENYDRLKDDANFYESGFSHYFLFVSLVMSTLIMDVLSLDVFAQTTEELEQREAGWDILRKRLSSVIRMRETETAPREQPPKTSRQIVGF